MHGAPAEDGPIGLAVEVADPQSEQRRRQHQGHGKHRGTGVDTFHRLGRSSERAWVWTE